MMSKPTQIVLTVAKKKLQVLPCRVTLVPA